MSNPNLSATDMRNLLEMVINAPVGSYANAMQKQGLVNKFVELHNQAQRGARVDALSASEAATVDKMRSDAAAAAAPAKPTKPATTAPKPANLRGGSVSAPKT